MVFFAFVTACATAVSVAQGLPVDESVIQQICLFMNDGSPALTAARLSDDVLIDPKNASLRLCLAITYVQLKDVDRTMRHLDKCLELDKDNCLALCIRACVFRDLGAWRSALNELEELLRIHPGYAKGLPL
jgi:Tfp pilus assembly protein PilF